MQIKINARRTSPGGKTTEFKSRDIEVTPIDGSVIITARDEEVRGRTERANDVTSTEREAFVRLEVEDMVKIIAAAAKYCQTHHWGLSVNPAKLAKIEKHLNAALSELESLKTLDEAKA